MPWRRRRVKRRIRLAARLRTLTPRQWLLLALGLVAAPGVSVALILALSPRPSPPAVASPVLESTPSPGLPSSVAPPGTPDTVRLVIPAGGIDLRVVPGDGIHVPLHLAVHYPGTSEPGGGSNSLFYAHAQPGMFLGLYSLHLGDEIRAFRADGSQLLYQVRTLHKVPATDLSVVRPTPYEEVTLLTCTTYDPRTPRYIVTATPV